LRPEIERGIPLVGLEPSCVAVFRDELKQLFPEDPLAKKLSGNTFLFSEFINRPHPNPLPGEEGGVRGKALVQGHCHHKTVLGMESEESVLKKMGLDFQILDAGCCGMAGAFGFEKDHYEISKQIGERRLLPAVRNAERDTLIIANGFSCREQIRQETGREAKHLAEVVREILRPPGFTSTSSARK
jgi:Fe-S oxidoreductase